MKQFVGFIVLLAVMVMTLSYISDLYEMIFNDRFYEGYIFAIKIGMFDVAMIIALIIVLFIRGNKELKLWMFISILLENGVLIMGFKLGAVFGVLLGIGSVVYYFMRKLGADEHRAT